MPSLNQIQLQNSLYQTIQYRKNELRQRRTPINTPKQQQQLQRRRHRQQQSQRLKQRGADNRDLRFDQRGIERNILVQTIENQISEIVPAVICNISEAIGQEVEPPLYEEESNRHQYN